MPRAECLTLASGSDRILVELFQILKDDAVESTALNMQYAGSWQMGVSPSPWWRPESRLGAVSRVAIRDQIRKEGEENWTLLCAFVQALRLAVHSSGSAPALLPSGVLVLVCLLHVGS